MGDEVQAAGVFDKLRYGRWLLGQGDELQEMLGYYESFREATTVRGKWEEGVRPAGDLTVGMIESFPASEDGGVVAMADVEALAEAKGIDREKWKLFFTTFLPIVLDAILKLRG